MNLRKNDFKRLLSLLMVVTMLLTLLFVSGCDKFGNKNTTGNDDAGNQGDVTDVVDDDTKDDVVDDDVVDLTFDDYLAQLPDPQALNYIFTQLEGFWVKKGDQFYRFAFDKKGVPTIEYGLWETEFWKGGKVTGVTVADDGVVTFQITVNKKTEKVVVDFSTYLTDGKLKIKTKNLNAKFATFKFGAKKQEAALKAARKIK